MHHLIKHLSIFTWMDILGSNEAAISFLEHLELIPRKVDPAPDCPKCFGPMDIMLKKSYHLGWCWVCRNRRGRMGAPCFGSINALEGTLFEGCRLPVEDVLGLMFGYVMKLSYSDMLIHMNRWRCVREEKEISQKTVMKFYTKFDEIIIIASTQRDKTIKWKDNYNREKLLKKYVKACKIPSNFQTILSQFLMDVKSRYPCFKKGLGNKTLHLPSSTTSSIKNSFSEKNESSDKTDKPASSSNVESEKTSVTIFSEKNQPSNKTAQSASSSSIVDSEKTNIGIFSEKSESSDKTAKSACVVTDKTPENSVSTDIKTKGYTTCKKIKLSNVPSTATAERTTFNQNKIGIKRCSELNTPPSASISVVPNSISNPYTSVSSDGDNIMYYDNMSVGIANTETLYSTTNSINDQIINTSIFEEGAYDKNENNVGGGMLVDSNKSFETTNFYDTFVYLIDNSVSTPPACVFFNDNELNDRLVMDVDDVETISTATQTDI